MEIHHSWNTNRQLVVVTGLDNIIMVYLTSQYSDRVLCTHVKSCLRGTEYKGYVLV